MSGTGIERHRISIRLIVLIFVLLHGVFLLEIYPDLVRLARQSSVGIADLWQALEGSAAMARSSGTTISRAYNMLVSMVLTSIALAIPLTANMYTPKLIEIFIKDRVNIAVLTFFVISSAQAIWSTQATWDQGLLKAQGGVYPRIAVWISFEAITLGWSILIPYFYYVFRFLNPVNIIDRVTETLLQEFDEVLVGRGDIERHKGQLAQKILHLGNVILRAVDRADRDVSLDAIRALKGVVIRYQHLKERFPPAWFAVEEELFVGCSHEAVRFINEERIWVEHKCLHQLLLAYNASLAKMPDAISAISDVNRIIALNAESQADLAGLRLGIRFFNTFLREAVKRKDVHAIFDIFHQYKELARDLLAYHPALALEIGRYLKYYADFARTSGLSFIYELGAYELGSIVEWAYQREAGSRRELLEILLGFDLPGSARLVKAKAILGGFFTERGFEAERELLRRNVAAAPAGAIEQARADLLGTKDSIFWEVTDRQVNVDYVDEVRKRSVAAFLEDAAKRPPAEAPQAVAGSAPAR